MTFIPPPFFRAALLLAALLAPLPVRAQPAADTAAAGPVVALPAVTVTAARTALAVEAAAARVTVLDAADARAAGATSVAALLEARTGAFVRRYGPGGLATLSLRGAGSSGTAVLLDGLPIADPQLGGVDLSLLPTLLLDRIEVVHGAGSALYGTDGLGGVVDLRSLRPSGPALRLSAGAGAWGERRLAALGGAGRGRTSGLALVEIETAEGDFPFHNASAFPARTDRRAGADRRRVSVYAAAAHAGRRHDLRAGAWYGTAERGLPGLAGTPPQGERQWDAHLRLWAQDDVRTGWGRLRLSALAQHGTLRYVHPALALDETGRTLRVSGEAEAQTLHGGWLLAAGATAGGARASHPALADDARQGRLGAFAHASGGVGRLLVYPAVRVDAYLAPDRTRLPVAPRLGLNLRPFAERALRLKASAGRAFRVPTFNDRFWRGAGVPDLRPEHGWTADAGVLLPHRGGRAEVSVYVSALRDGIVWAPDPDGTWRPGNRARIATRGLEASWQGGRRVGGARLTGAAVYAWTDARDRSDPADPSYGHPLRYTPRETLKLTLGAALGPAAIDIGARYTGRRYVATDGTDWLRPFVVLDAGLSLRGRLGAFAADLGLRAENVLDARYAVLQGHPMPPRHLRLRLLLETLPNP